VNRRFGWAMVWFAILAVLAAVLLRGPFRTVVWIFLGGLVVKTWIAWKRLT